MGELTSSILCTNVGAFVLEVWLFPLLAATSSYQVRYEGVLQVGHIPSSMLIFSSVVGSC